METVPTLVPLSKFQHNVLAVSVCLIRLWDLSMAEW